MKARDGVDFVPFVRNDRSSVWINPFQVCFVARSDQGSATVVFDNDTWIELDDELDEVIDALMEMDDD